MGSILAFSYIGYFGHIQPHHCLLFPTSPDALPLLWPLPSEESGFWGLVLHSGGVWGLAIPLYLLIFAFLYLCSYGICDSFVHDSFLFALRTWSSSLTKSLKWPTFPGICPTRTKPMDNAFSCPCRKYTGKHPQILWFLSLGARWNPCCQECWNLECYSIQWGLLYCCMQKQPIWTC